MPAIDITKISTEIEQKYLIRDNTFYATPKDDIKDLVEVEVGDSKVTGEFLPQIKVCRWGNKDGTNEVNFSARLVTNELTPIVTTEADKIIWQGEKTEAHFYDIQNEEYPEGGYEFEIILKEKPLTNKIKFTLETKGLDFFYQLELTQEEIDQGTERPENVVGSYAVYASENKVNYVGRKEYKCGKVGHIFRPKIIDSAGTEVWGELNIENGVLSVTIPQEFLDNAAYPIRHAAGLTFGYTSVGGTEDNTTAANANNAASPAESGNVTKLTTYGRQQNGSMVVGVAIYSDSSGAPDSKLAEDSGNGNLPVSSAWVDVNISYSFAASTTYWLVNWTSVNAPYGGYYNFDSIGGYTRNRYTAAAFENWPATWASAGTNASRRISIYATYTAGEGEPTTSHTNLSLTGVG